MKKAPKITIKFSPQVKPLKLPRILCVNDAYNLFKESWDMDTFFMIEQLRAMYLNSNGRVLGIYDVSCGGLTSTQADIRLIFLGAIKCCATTVILAHNHPSGNREASPSDIKITRRMQEAGRVLDIKVWDHLILTPEGYSSMRVRKEIR